MSPSISPPSPEALAELQLAHAHRFPELARLPVPGEGEATVNLPLLLGIPTGAAKMPEGQPTSSAWARLVAEALGFRPESDMGEVLVRDCLLWPPPALWRSWCDYWPALEAPALRLVKRKIGYHADAIEAPEPGTPKPEGLKLSSRGLVRFLKPAKSVERTIGVEPPASDAWRLYLGAVKSPEGDAAKWTREIVDEVTGGAAADLLDRYPGLIISLAKSAGYLAGAGAEGELGNW